MKRVIIDGHVFEDVDFNDGMHSLKMDDKFYAYVSVPSGEGWSESDVNGNVFGGWVADDVNVMMDYAVSLLHPDSNFGYGFNEETVKECYTDEYANLILDFLGKIKDPGFVQITN